MQPKLLRVLERGRCAGSAPPATEQVDVRLVAATNRELAREVNRGTFREDLLLPPGRGAGAAAAAARAARGLRLLVEHFIARRCGRRRPGGPGDHGRHLRGNWRKLEQLPWPGNVRELRNFIERTLILSGGPIESQHLPAPAEAAAAAAGVGATAVDLERPFSAHKAEVVADFERAYLLGQLARHDNNVSAAARAAGMDRMNFKRLLKKHR